MGRAKGHPSLAVCDCAGNVGSRERRALAERVFFFFGMPLPHEDRWLPKQTALQRAMWVRS